ncbi:hypothetical protein [Legionella sp. PC1000]|uniref:hypothetical protein n=1 Tax=Legionella sp. PC1000 TaxID=2746060 RepID=UPI0015F8DE85|nr:hypothetical protein [Legionella sp. PC1000]
MFARSTQTTKIDIGIAQRSEEINHLHLESIDALVESIQAFPGAVLFVSHNRHFIDSISTLEQTISQQLKSISL